MAITALLAVNGFIQEALSSLKSITFINNASITILALHYRAQNSLKRSGSCPQSQINAVTEG